MTGTLPPWSPLNDPRLSAQIQERLRDEREPFRNRALRDLYFLERYAWQEYPVKCGRWRVGAASSFTLTGGTNLSGPWTRKEWNADLSCVLLLDPSTREPIAAHTVDWWTDVDDGGHPLKPVDTRTTSIWFAGDPRVCGLFTPVGDGHRTAFGFRFGKSGLRSWKEGPAGFEKTASLIAAEPFADTTASEFGPWIADRPEPPPRPKRFSRATWS